MIAADLDRAPLPRLAGTHTHANHFRFGYDTQEFSARQNGAARYWTEYGRPSRAHRDFPAELELALGEIATHHGRLSIAGSGGPISRVVAFLAERLGLDAVVTRIELDGVAAPDLDGRLPVDTHEYRFDTFAEFALSFAARAGCGDAWVALAAFHAAHAVAPQIADHGEIRLVDYGIDERLAAIVAPPSLCLIDNEAFTALDRWLIAEGRAGIPQFLRWSPELMAAQLDSPPMRAWVAAATGDDAALRSWTNRAARRALWRRSFPELDLSDDARGAWADAVLRRRMIELSRRMRRLSPGCGMQHVTALHRLAARFALDLGFSLGEGAALYGRVTEAPMAAAGDPS